MLTPTTFNILTVPAAQLIEQIQVKDPYLLDCLRALSGESEHTQRALQGLFQNLNTIINNIEQSDDYVDIFLLMGA